MTQTDIFEKSKLIEFIRYAAQKKTRYLYLNNYLITELPVEIVELTELEFLYLSNNQLSTLPVEIGGLKKLYHLDVSFNQLNYLPTELCNLEQLHYLYATNNRLSTLPPNLNSQLKELDLSYNNLNSLPESIGHLTQLQELYLQSNKLTSLPTTFGHLSNLKDLNLSNNELTFFPQEATSTASLEKINLSHNQLTSLPDKLAFSQIQNINLSFNQLATVPDSIKSLIKLKYLDLRHNQLQKLPCSINDFPLLDHIRLDNNPLLSGEDKENYNTIVMLKSPQRNLGQLRSTIPVIIAISCVYALYFILKSAFLYFFDYVPPFLNGMSILILLVLFGALWVIVEKARNSQSFLFSDVPFFDISSDSQTFRPQIEEDIIPNISISTEYKNGSDICIIKLSGSVTSQNSRPFISFIRDTYRGTDGKVIIDLSDLQSNDYCTSAMIGSWRYFSYREIDVRMLNIQENLRIYAERPNAYEGFCFYSSVESAIKSFSESPKPKVEKQEYVHENKGPATPDEKRHSGGTKTSLFSGMRFPKTSIWDKLKGIIHLVVRILIAAPIIWMISFVSTEKYESFSQFFSIYIVAVGFGVPIVILIAGVLIFLRRRMKI
ncbi:leucine-rich repeat domain-containing protein [Candidatus Uabimicrobium amorphum]|uniref:Disease resistance R13L4/SHOC-2-like LRR domain-containing protein n=1 Tax=Uabimicrobium amorphum TaxID=2596890 RepID=A0A5S9F5I0_UABAM|nr:leucine-rich repeat domain-containing protein [Candidatus Uabimicrobium amorphum]BBM86885.1 hypothetical protein UABAM_05287 [Candidatus Uabimicrobium amorphum]